MVMRTYGLSGSGMDVDQMVKDLMKARRVSYDKVWQKKTQVEWKKQDVNTIYTLAEDFRNKTIADFKKQTTLSPKQVTSTNETVASATANADAANVTHSLIVQQLADGVKLSSSGSITADGKTKESLAKQFDGIAEDAEFNLQINGKTIAVTGKMSLNEVVSKINNAGADVKANYDATLDRFYLFSNKTGAAATISFDGTDAKGNEFLDKLQIDRSKTHTGQDAIIELDGVELKQSSNTFTISGVTYTLKAASFIGSDNKPIPTNISVQPDIDKTIDNVQSFVDSYNTFMALIQKELNEDKYSDFAPLTDAQKADMKDSEIKAWEEKAKSGSLRRDPILTQMASGLRMSFTEPIKGLTGKYQSATDIGIGTGKYFDDDGKLTAEASNGGKIYVDKDELRKALEEDPDAVFKIFGTPGDTQSTEGVANRLYDQMQTSLNRLKTEAGTPNVTDTTSNMAKSIASYKDQLSDMNNRLAQVEARYYKQFNAMETALSNLSKQSAWLSQQLGG